MSKIIKNNKYRYAEKINLLTNENETLKKYLEDVQTSLKINKEILYNHLTQKGGDDIIKSINELKKENERLTLKINWLFTEKTESAKQLNKLQLELEEKIQKEKDLIEREKQFKFIEENKQKKRENELIIKNKKINNNKNIIYIGDPNKFNVEMNTELTQTRALIKKYNHLLQQEKLISHRLKEKVQELEENIKKINNGILPKINDTNIEVIDCLFSEDDDDDLDDDFEVKKEEEQEIQFPDKLNFNRTKTSENNSNIPKLDLSQVLIKYKKPENLKIIDAPNKITHRSGDGEIIDKFKAQIKIYKQTIQRYKERIKKLRQQVSILRNKNKILESTIKNNSCSNSNRIIIQDESMNVNVSQIGDLNSVSTKNIDSKNEIDNDKLENIEIKKEN